MSNLRFAVWGYNGKVHVVQSEAHGWTHALCNHEGGPTDATEFIDLNVQHEQPTCAVCIKRLAEEAAHNARMLQLAQQAAYYWAHKETSP